jgi:hypothetical protein
MLESIFGGGEDVTQTDGERRTESRNLWLLGERLILDASPLSAAEPYSECLTHHASHIDYWTAQQRIGVLPRDIEYEEPPRGRVVYKTKTQRFQLYADRCILKRKSEVSRIMKAMSLPPKLTDVGTDGHFGHYMCTKCMDTSYKLKDDL